MLTLKLAWRNIWRNRRRTLITAAAIGLGVATLVFAFGLFDGMFGRMVKVATASMSGDAQIHKTGYRQTLDERLLIDDPAPLLAAARGVGEAAPRVFGNGLAAIGARSQGVRVVGVDIPAEQRVTNWSERLTAGRYIKGPGEVMVGADLARKLDLELDTRLVVTLADLETGEARGEALRIVGVLSTGDLGVDKRSVIVDIGVARRMLGISRGAHEIAIDLPGVADDRAAVQDAIAPLAADGIEVVGWHTINRVLAQAVELQGLYMGLFIAVIFFILAFGIVNTLAMSLAERWHEFGVLRAIGTTPGRLGGLILTEAGAIGLVGSLPGAVLGSLLCLWAGQVGIDMAGTSAYGVTLTDPLFPVLDPIAPLWLGALFTALTVSVAGLSAWRAARVEPVQAMRR